MARADTDEGTRRYLPREICVVVTPRKGGESLQSTVYETVRGQLNQVFRSLDPSFALPGVGSFGADLRLSALRTVVSGRDLLVRPSLPPPINPNSVVPSPDVLLR